MNEGESKGEVIASASMERERLAKMADEQGGRWLGIRAHIAADWRTIARILRGTEGGAAVVEGWAKKRRDSELVWDYFFASGGRVSREFDGSDVGDDDGAVRATLYIHAAPTETTR